MVQYYNIGLVPHCRSGHLEKKRNGKPSPCWEFSPRKLTLGILSRNYTRSRGANYNYESSIECRLKFRSHSVLLSDQVHEHCKLARCAQRFTSCYRLSEEFVLIIEIRLVSKCRGMIFRGGRKRTALPVMLVCHIASLTLASAIIVSRL